MNYKLAIFASGSGSNAENLVNYFKDSKEISIVNIFCNNPNAFVIIRAKKLKIPCSIFNRADFYDTDLVMSQLEELDIDFIVLAGFLWLIPQKMVEKYPDKIINIHPALLPKFGGKGMYGAKVHEQVVLNKEKETGITIHYVNEHYDEGNVIFQAKTEVLNSDTSEIVAAKVHDLEYQYFPSVVEKCILRNKQ
jgi:phosphoribosylglycinamide formyltransferase-1